MVEDGKLDERLKECTWYEQRGGGGGGEERGNGKGYFAESWLQRSEDS